MSGPAGGVYAGFVTGPSGQTVTDAREALRDQFAINAPPVPDWFDVPMPAAYPLRGTAQEQEQWRTRRAIDRLVQWPYHYADLVLAERYVVQARGEQR